MPGKLIATATIASSTGVGPTSSSAVALKESVDRLPGFTVGVAASTAAFDGTVTVQVDATSTGAWRALQDGGSDVTIAAGKAIWMQDLPFPRLRLQSSTGEAADRTFRIWLQ